MRLTAQQFPETQHLWVWINEPQHAAAVQAILALLTTFAAIWAALAASAAYRKTVDQVRIANDQLEVARKQATAAQLPYLLVEEEESRPEWGMKGTILMVHNSGAGPVTDAYWIRTAALIRGKKDPQVARWARVGSISTGGKSPLPLRGEDEKYAVSLNKSSIVIHYKDLEGTIHVCRCTETRLGPFCDNSVLPVEEPSPLKQLPPDVEN